ncbi:LLM class flavin-dependent oxidoreductase [Streptomyces sp. NPDC088747]|uniref:LLM class flavin-dependent oxidoreductase n=1 Tax=Streptomyces sp. NPDC088747 TaxID=3365886 RepID=UPI00382980DE
MFISVFMGPASRTPAEDLPLIDLCLEQAVAAAQAGCCMVTFGEQHFNNYEPYANPFMMAARLAPDLGGTWFGTTIVPLVLNHPLRVAENAAVADVLTRGRFLMGLSAGRVGFSPDFANFGIDPARRDAVFDAKLDILLRARAHREEDGPLSFETPWDTCAISGRLMPMSYRSGGPQLAIGTNTDATIERFAELGWPLFLGPCHPRMAARKLKLHRDTMAEAGLPRSVVDDATSKSFVTRHVIVGTTEDEAWERAELMAGRAPMMDRSADPRSLRELARAPFDPTAMHDPRNRNAAHVQSWIIAGTPDQVTEQILDYEKSGIPHLNTRFTVGTYNPDAIRDSFGLFSREVVPMLSPQLFADLEPAEVSAEYRTGTVGEGRS